MTATAIDELAQAEAAPQSVVDRRPDIESRQGISQVHGLWALGIAERSLGNVAESIRSLERAKELAHEGGLPVEVVEIDISLAASIAMSGRPQDAEQALSAACDHASELVRAHARTQLAGIIARRGALEEARSLFDAALPVLTAHNDTRWLCLLHSNLGLVLTYLGEFDDAERSLQSAASLYLSLDRFSSHAEMIVNRAFVAVQRGDIARSLDLLAEAERLYRIHGLPLHTVVVDRGRAMALGGLGARAYELLVEQVPELIAMSRNLEAAETLVSAAQAALLGGKAPEAVDVAQEASRILADQRRESWHNEARLLALRAMEAAGKDVDPEAALELAEDLSQSFNREGAQQATWLACRAAAQTGNSQTAALALARANELASRGDTWLTRVDRAHSAALVDRLEGKHGRARRHLWNASRVIAQHRSTLASLESQVATSHVARPVAVLGLRELHEHGNPSDVVRWLETVRVSSTRYPPVKRPGDRTLQILLAELRGLELEIEEATRTGIAAPELRRERVRLERALAERSLAFGATSESLTPASTADIRSALGESEMAIMYVVDGSLFAVRLRSHSVRSIQLGDAGSLDVDIRVLRSMLRRAADGHDVEADRLERQIAHVRERLINPLNLVSDNLVVVPPPAFGAVPWPAVAGAERRITVAPTASSWLHRHNREASTDADSMVAVAGPGLMFAEPEARQIAARYPSSTVLSSSDATVEPTLAAIQGARVAHLACHGTLRIDNPMFSALTLYDGPLNLYDLVALAQTPEIVVLSACDTATNQHEAGLDVLGLSSVLFAAGADSVIAPVVAIPDSAHTVEVMDHIHRSLAKGESTAEACRQLVADFGTPSALSLMAFGS